MKDKVHCCIAEIYKAADKIKDFSNSFLSKNEIDIQSARIIIHRLCDYIQACDKLMHDELFPSEADKNE